MEQKVFNFYIVIPLVLGILSHKYFAFCFEVFLLSKRTPSADHIIIL